MSLEVALKVQGLRITAARKAVYSTLLQSSKALSAKEVFEKLDRKKKNRVDLVSVYRNLELFSDLGIAHEVFSGKYSVCEQELNDGHQHVHIVSVCTDCGVSSEVKEHDQLTCELSNSLKKQSQALRRVSSITLRGVCGDCLQ